MGISANISVFFVLLLVLSVPSLVWAEDSCLCDCMMQQVIELTQLPITLKMKGGKSSPLGYDLHHFPG